MEENKNTCKCGNECKDEGLEKILQIYTQDTDIK